MKNTVKKSDDEVIMLVATDDEAIMPVPCDNEAVNN